MNSIVELARQIESRAKDRERYVVAISGFGGAGKSTTSAELAKILDNTTLIHTDDFIDADENGALEGYHLNWIKLEDQVIKVVKIAAKVTSRIYDWNSNRIVYEKLPVSKFTIIEGSIWLIQDKYKPYFDMTVWVNVPQDIANARGKKRDKEEYGVDHDEIWDQIWSPREKESFDTLKPDKNADILLDNIYF